MLRWWADRSPDLGEQLFFHASEVVLPDDFKGSKVAYFAQHFAAGDEVAFVVGTGQRGNLVGQQVTSFAVVPPTMAFTGFFWPASGVI